MADSDKELKILLTILTKEVGPQKAAEVLKKVKEETKSAAKETRDFGQATANVAKKDVPELERATAKAGTATKDWRAATRGLALQFPFLGRVASAALNPITLAVTAAIGAFQIWKFRVDALTKALGGVEMPDVSQSDIERIELMAGAWGKYAASVASASGDTKKIREELTQALRAIKLIEDFRKAAGVADPKGAAAAESQALAQAENNLRLEARRIRERAGTPGSVEREQGLLADEKKLAEAAATQIAEQREILGLVAEAEGGNIGAFLKLQMKLGGKPDMANSKWFESARATAQENIASHQGVLARYQDRLNAVGNRAAARSEWERAAAMDAEADRLGLQGSNVRGEEAIRAGGSARGRINTAAAGVDAGAAQGNIAAISASAVEIVRGLQDIAAAFESVRRESQRTASRMNAQLNTE
ncbi:MAG: hypothetical protein IH623_09470 [Verrucomicrobia bacterium]|nr:hypothetical protein [Verrucomicrobiota bacterium]